MTEKIIELHDLRFSYGVNAVLEGANAHFHPGRFSVLLGANGAGKSTLFRVMAGLLGGYSGRVVVRGRENRKLRFKQRAGLMGFLPQFNTPAFPYTVSEVMLTGRAAFSGLSPRQADRKHLDTVLDELGIFALRDRTVTELSGGERQLVMIGRLLMQRPQILLLDEPTNHLDVYHQHYLMRKLKDYTRQGITVVAIMHDPTLAYQYADDFFFMHDKRVLTSASHQPDLDVLKKVYAVEFADLAHGGGRLVVPNRF